MAHECFRNSNTLPIQNVICISNMQCSHRKFKWTLHQHVYLNRTSQFTQTFTLTNIEFEALIRFPYAWFVQLTIVDMHCKRERVMQERVHHAREERRTSTVVTQANKHKFIVDIFEWIRFDLNGIVSLIRFCVSDVFWY